MNRKLCVLCLLSALLFLSGCARRQAAASLSPAQVASAMLLSQQNLPAITRLTPQDEDFAAFLSGDYGVDPSTVSDGAICYAEGVEASEIAVLTLTDEANIPDAQDALTAYARSRAALFEGYAPIQAAMAQNAKVAVSGRHIALIICPDTASAESAFQSGLGAAASSSADALQDASPEAAVPAGLGAESDAGFHADAILAAWQSGDASSLSEIDRQILSAAREVIARETTDAMSDYEKELAIHDWLTRFSSFDLSAFSRNPGSGSGTDSDTPYGVFINRTGNCWGYASTFKLLMNMLDIECITVLGTPRSNGVEHAWNMVKLEGEWYCVDAAWDDPIGGSPNHRYFNVSSEELRHSGIHSWDESLTPEATATAYRYQTP